MKNRELIKTIKGYKTRDGAGVKLIRVLSQEDVKDIDPFLMLDAFHSDQPEDYLPGFPMHPHRGIETITYLFKGQIEHQDTLGNKGSLEGGQLQWMTAGKGILHEEMPKGTQGINGLQFWVNLPSKDKMTPPTYFPIDDTMIKKIPIEGGRVDLIAGDFQGVKGIQSPHADITMQGITLESKVKLEMPIKETHNAFIYLVKGSLKIGIEEKLLEQESAGILGEGNHLTVTASAEGAHFVLLTGKPLKEPIAWGGPIVMNTKDELNRAFEELKNGTFLN